MSTVIPEGTWTSDKTHSTFGFSARHLVVATYRGTLLDFDATVVGNPDGSCQLDAAARVASVSTTDENLTGHLLAPDFFDAQRFPEVRYHATEISRDGDHLIVSGQLSLKGVTKDIVLHGEIAGPTVGFEDREILGITLEGTIDRTEFGITWNATLPTGGLVLGHEVKLVANLELARA